MRNYLLVSTILTLFCFSSFGQETKNREEEKKVSHYLGVQTNELIKQILNFGNSVETGNPFLLKYCLRFNKSNLELTTGLGYRTFATSRNGGNLKTNASEVFFRLGTAKKFNIGKRWEAGVGIDGVFTQAENRSENLSVNQNNNFYDSTYSTTKNVEQNFGFGPQLTLAYYINPRLKLGTELTTYFTYTEDKSESNTERVTIQNGFRTETSLEESATTFSNSLNLTVPVAIFLIVKF